MARSRHFLPNSTDDSGGSAKEKLLLDECDTVEAWRLPARAHELGGRAYGYRLGSTDRIDC